CETYSFEKRSPASSLCVSPAATRSWRSRSPRRIPSGLVRRAVRLAVSRMGMVSWRCFSQAHTSLKRKLGGSTIPHLSVFIAKMGQPWETQNHLTEVLDETRKASYSEQTLQPGRTPGRGSQGARRKSRQRNGSGWAADPPPKSRQEWRASREGPGAAAGAFSLLRVGLDQPRSQLRRAARIAWSSLSSNSPTR